MKQFLLLTFTFLLFSFVQPTNDPLKALYAYKQELKSGVNDGNMKKRPVRFKYRIFLEKKNNEDVVASRIWINGKERFFDFAVINTPVLIEKPFMLKNKTFDTLVPVTVNEVLEMNVKQEKEKGISMPGKLKNYELLIEYSLQGKKFYVGNLKMKTITPRMNL
jgi:hypothetical protein